MKKIYIFLLITFFANHLMAQDTTRIEQYCEISAVGGLKVNIDFGQKQKTFSNRGRIISTDFNSVVDALNFMGFRGWVLVNAFPRDRNYISYVMKKTCYKTEIVELKMELERLAR